MLFPLIWARRLFPTFTGMRGAVISRSYQVITHRLRPSERGVRSTAHEGLARSTATSGPATPTRKHGEFTRSRLSGTERALSRTGPHPGCGARYPRTTHGAAHGPLAKRLRVTKQPARERLGWSRRTRVAATTTLDWRSQHRMLCCRLGAAGAPSPPERRLHPACHGIVFATCAVIATSSGRRSG